MDMGSQAKQNEAVNNSLLRSLFVTLSCVFSVCSALFFSSSNVSSVLALSDSPDEDWMDVESVDMLENSRDFITLSEDHRHICNIH